MRQPLSVCVLMMGALLSVAVTGGAQTGTGGIAGTVKDATGAVLPGVTVEASSPALIEKTRVAVSDGAGQYKVIELPPGVYSVTFALPGFTGVRREGIRLTTGFTATVDADLQIGDVAETITVSGESPIVDIQNVRQQAVMPREVMDTIPTGKTVFSLGVLVPGVAARNTTGGAAQDVGGSSGWGVGTRLAIHGSRHIDQTLQINGMAIGMNSNESISTFNLSDANFEELQMEVAAHSAEAETGGVRINGIPRDGGNVFSGRFAGDFTNGALQSDNYTEELAARGLRAPNSIKRLWNASASLGGPIVHDRLWFFGNFGSIGTEQYVAGEFVNTTPTSWVPTFDLNQQAVFDERTWDFAGRLTWQAASKHKVGLYYNQNRICICHHLLGLSGTTLRGPEASNRDRRPNYLTVVTWTAPLTNRLLFDAGVSFSPQTTDRVPQPGVTELPITELTLSRIYRGPTVSPTYFKSRKDMLRSSVAYVTGSHAIKTGFTLLYDATTNRNSVQPISYTGLNFRPVSVTYSGNPVVSYARNWPRLGLFAQDQWTYRRMTVNAGLRFDYLKSTLPEVHLPPTQFIPVPRDFPEQEAVGWKDLSPRFGVSYDLFGTGRTAVKASLSRFISQIGLPATDLSIVTSNNSVTRAWTDPNGDFAVQGDPLNPAANGELGPSQNLNFGRPVPSIRYDPEWAFGWHKRPANWETSAGVQHQIVSGVSVTAMYFRRVFGNFDVIDNLAVGPSDYDPYCITAPLDSRLPNGGGYPVCGLFDLNPTKLGQINRVRTSASNFGKQIEHWNGGDFTVNARLHKLLLQGGISTGRTLTDNCDVVSKIDNPSQSPAANVLQAQDFCRVQTGFFTDLKILGSYTLPWQVLIAATYQSIPGTHEQTAGFASGPGASSTFGILGNYVATNAQIAPSLGRNLASGTTATINIVAPATIFTERLNQLDLRLAKIVNLRRTRVQGMVDLYNVFNASTILQVNNTYGTNGAAWQVPLAIVQGRLLKFGVQVNF